jgi:hypothetical protein
MIPFGHKYLAGCFNNAILIQFPGFLFFYDRNSGVRYSYSDDTIFRIPRISQDSQAVRLGKKAILQEALQAERGRHLGRNDYTPWRY